MIEDRTLVFLQEREEQELEIAYRSTSPTVKNWHLAIASGYSRRILEIEQNMGIRRSKIA